MKKNSVTILLILCTLLSGMSLRLSFLQKQLIPRQTGDNISAPEGEFASGEPTEILEDESLFRALWEPGLILPVSDDLLEMKPPDYFLIQKAEHPDLPDTEEMKQQEKLLNALYHSPAGHMRMILSGPLS